MTRNIYNYEGNEFSSIKKLAEYVGIKEKTLTARLRRGMSVEEACNKEDLRCSYYEDGNVEKSLTQICKEQEKDKALVHNRLRYGYSLNDALNKPKKILRQGIPIVVYGILYNSISAALRSLDLTDKESLVRRRLKSGMKPDQAFNVKKSEKETLLNYFLSNWYDIKGFLSLLDNIKIAEEELLKSEFEYWQSKLEYLREEYHGLIDEYVKMHPDADIEEEIKSIREYKDLLKQGGYDTEGEK